MLIKAQSILIIPGQQPDSGIWESTLALSLALKKAKKTYLILLDEKDRSLEDNKEIEKASIFNPNSAKDLVITLGRFEDKISTIDWEQTDQEVKIRLSTEQGDIGNPDIAISRTHNFFDLRIFIDINPEQAQSIDSLKVLDFSKGESIFIKSSTDTDIVPILIYKFIKKNKLKLDPNSAKKLLAGIYRATKNFTTTQNSETFLVASQLMTIINKPDLEEKLIPEKTKTEITTVSEKKKYPPNIEVKEPEELPANFDPLAPAKEIPQPLTFGDKTQTPKPVINTPLPEAQ